ncbi:uncharacterized protein LOC124406468 [Diprion similis]|uniref:uncharacterized protein LOC124406468 n=1 Tax=Diprion similis TaxID=362088 RepID=UPI001EF97703|nr:uncharacterized protein LOC124406468 [Diprion similis]
MYKYLRFFTTEKCSTDLCRESHSKKLNQEYFLLAKQLQSANSNEANHVKYLITNILVITEKIIPKLNGRKVEEKSTAAGNYSPKSVTNFSKTDRSFVASPFNKSSKTSKDLIIGLTQSNRVVEPLGNAELKRAIEPYESTSGNPIAEIDQGLQNHRNYEAITAFETLKLPISNSACTKKSINRCKAMLRNSTVNNSTNNSRSVVCPQTVIKNQKLPIKKYCGNGIVQSSISDALNNERVYSLPLSSLKRKKNTTSEHARNKKLQLPVTSMPNTVKNPANVVTKSVIKPYDTTSLVKMKSSPTRELGTEKSEMVFVNRSNVQPTAEVSKSKARKPRSKSKTRTRTLNKIGRVRVTEVPLEHTIDYAPLTESRVPINQDLPLPKKTSSPKHIIQLLEELIKYSNHETSIPSIYSVPVIARRNGHVEDTKNSISNLAPSKVRPETNIRSNSQPSEFTIGDDEVKESTKAYSETNSNDVTTGYSRTSILNIGCRAHLSGDPNSMSCLSSKYCQVSSTSLASYEMSEEIISNQISDSILTSDGSQKVLNDSNEYFDIGENTRQISNNRIQRFCEDENITVNSDVIPKKKFVNKHARALDMLKKILSDHGVSNERLSRAENKSRDRWGFDSIRKELSVTKSLDANLINQGNSDKIVSRISSSDRNFSRLLVSKLATLSESESDLHYMEVATMTSVKDLDVKTNDNTKLSRIESIFTNKKDADLSEFVIVENSTQFDIISKSDKSLGDLTMSDTLVSGALQSTNTSVDSSAASYTSPSTFHSPSTILKVVTPKINEFLEYELSNDIIEAFRLASIRTANLYAAIDLLKKNVPSDSKTKSHSLAIQNTDDIPTRIPTNINTSAVIETLCNANRTVPDHIQNSSKDCSSDIGNRSFIQTGNSKTIRTKISEQIMATEKPEIDTEYSAVTKVPEKTLSTVKVAKEHTTNGKLQTTYNHHLVDSTQPETIPKTWTNKQPKATKLAGVTIDRKAIAEPQGSNLGQCSTFKGKSIPSAEIPSEPYCFVKEASQLGVNDRSITNKCLETLHFAGKASNTGSRHSDTESKPKCSFPNANTTSKTVTKVQDSIPGSRIKTLLEKNLQHFSIACNSIDDEMVCESEEDDRFIESSNDDESISTNYSDTATSTACIYSANCYVIPEVTCVLDDLLNEVVKICDLLSSKDQNSVNTKSIQCCDLKKSQRKSKVFKCGRRSVLCEKSWSAVSGAIVSRERILYLIYAVICSFVFFGLHFSVYCELQ